MMHGRQEWNMAALWLAIVMVLASAAFYVPQRVVQAADPASAIQSRLAPSLPVRLLNAITPPAGADGIGLVDPTSGVWHLRTRGGDPAVFYFGVPGDFPIMGDWDCDGVDTPGLYRQSDGFVYLRNSNTGGPGEIRFFFGNPGDIPIAGDFDGDGCDTVSIYRFDITTPFVSPTRLVDPERGCRPPRTLPHIRSNRAPTIPPVPNTSTGPHASRRDTPA